MAAPCILLILYLQSTITAFSLSLVPRRTRGLMQQPLVCLDGLKG